MSSLPLHQRVPSIEESTVAIRQLIEIWNLHNKGANVEIPIIDGTPLTGITIHIMAHHSVVLSEAILLLTSAKMNLQSVPLIRLTVECAVTAAWLSVTPNAGKAAYHERARNRLETIKAYFQDPQYRDDELLTDATEELKDWSEHKSNAAKFIEKRCGQLSGGNQIYVIYRLMSASSHAGIGLTDHYLKEVEETKENPYGVSLLPSPDYPSAEVSLAHQIGMLALVLTAWDDISPGHPSHEAIRQVAGKFGFGLEIKLANTE